MAKDKHHAVFVEWWNYWMSKIPDRREALESSVRHLNSKMDSRADLGRVLQSVRRRGTPTERRIDPQNGNAGQNEPRTGGWED